MRLLAPALAVVAITWASPGAPLHAGRAEDAALHAFWEARNPRDAERVAQRIAADGAAFDETWTRLKAGRAYLRQPAGRLEMPSTLHGVRLLNVVEIPADYAPDRKVPLRVSLHGGVSREPPAAGRPGRTLANRVPIGGSEIVLHPEAWESSEWWKSGQVDNILTLLDDVKRKYNVDESHVSVTGISDGGTGVYFLAMRDVTPWSACLPLNGHPTVLANPDVGADGELFAGNLVNCPLYIVNGGRDRLYPAASVAPLVVMMRRTGSEPVFHVHPDAGHDVSWWPKERPLYEEYLRTHARVAHPDRVSWETERTDRYNRVRWLIVNRLGKRPTDAALEDVNSFEAVPGRQVPLYDRSKPSGRVDIVRRGNVLDAKTRGVAEFTVLLSPDVVDFSQPVQVMVNGVLAFKGVVKRDVATLLRWAARDNDRTMLYGAELKISVP